MVERPARNGFKGSLSVPYIFRPKIFCPSGRAGSSPAVRASFFQAAPEGGVVLTAFHSHRLRLIGSRHSPPMRPPICQRTSAPTAPLPAPSRATYLPTPPGSVHTAIQTHSATPPLRPSTPYTTTPEVT